jgi:emopamil binding protein
MADAGGASSPTARRPIWLYILAVYSLLLGVVTGIPQLYYVLYGLHLVDIGPHTNLLGQVWYWFNFNGESGYIAPDPGFWAGAVLDGLVLGPLYIAASIGLWQRRQWVIPVGLCAASLLFYGVMLLILSDLYSHLHAVTNGLSYWLSNIPYLIYPFWMLYTLTARRKLFTR